ncbi:hypothetical protein U9M48_028471 [Paspalum notatum var. saurae]|uniref:Uncharacterized protein n=1 Tax=Paspalum notatum var. saurae TaxID=547442 RepID=A0AAQ3TVG5_PASNO
MTEVMVWSRHIYCFGHRGYRTTARHQSADYLAEKGGFLGARLCVYIQVGTQPGASPNDEVEYTRYALAVTKRTYHQSYVRLVANQGELPE